MGISAVLLAYQEADNLRVLLPRLKEELDACGGQAWEILVVDTAEPTDDTPEVCASLGARYINQEEPGFGGAFRTAIRHAGEDVFLIMDADGSHPVERVPALWELFSTGGYDVVIGSRYCRGGVSNDAFASRVMSHMLNFTYRLVIGVSARDLSTDFRMYHTAALQKVELACMNYDVLEEVLLKLKLNKDDRRLRVGEVPITFNKRLFGESKRQLGKYIASYVATLFKLLGIRVRASAGR